MGAAQQSNDAAPTLSLGGANTKTLYRIEDWDKHFENNRTRDLKHMDWVPVPNRMDGDGYTELVEVRRGEGPFSGAVRLGTWLSIVEVASRCEPRGTLARESRRKVRDARTQVRGTPQAPAEPLIPHDFDSLARITRLPREAFELTFPRLEEIGWVVSEMVVFTVDTTIPQEGAGETAPRRTLMRESDYGTERNGTERNTSVETTEGGVSRGDSAFDRAVDTDEADSAGTAVKASAAKAGTGKAARKKPKAEAKPEHGEVKTYFFEQWKARYHADYAWKNERDNAHVKWILDQLDRSAEKAKAVIDVFLKDEDRWLVDKAHELGLLVSGFNRYRARQSQPYADPETGFVRKSEEEILSTINDIFGDDHHDAE